MIFLNLVLAGLRLGLKNCQAGEKWIFDDYSYLCKGLKNRQNERYKVPFERIKEVVEYYAGVKKEDMEDLRQMFLAKWTPEKVKNMTLKEYTNIGKGRDDFTFWLENKMELVLSIWGGSSYKFGIYERHPDSEDNFKEESKRKTDGTYAWLGKYGDSREAVFSKVKEIILKIIENAKNKQFDLIDDIDLGDAYKWAIAYHFSPKESLLGIASGDAYKYFSRKYFNGEIKKISQIQEALIKLKLDDTSFHDYEKQLWNEYAKNKKDSRDNQDGDMKSECKIMNAPLNQILYGPPGTGKTYSTVRKALEILKATKEQKQKIISIRKLKKEFGSQVEFVTFHQSFSYEDFVEGLKANSDDGELSYNIENGIFKQICENAQNNLDNAVQNNANQTDIKLLLNDFANYVENEDAQGKQILLAKKSDGFRGDTYFGNILRKNDDSFKSFQTAGSVASQNLTEKIIIRDYQSFYDGNIKSYKEIKPMYKSKTSYHSNAIYYYQLFERIKEFQDGKFEQIASYFIGSNETIKKDYVLIIDEINRGNISRIFGELITLIEPSKRAGAEETISVKLPYSKDKEEDFSVPNNLYIIGTMNTADRSLTLMDTALRRRFDFIEMMPDADLVNGNFDGIDVKKILELINQRIEVLYDREHLIGHSFLMNINSLDELRNAFKNKILPLLEEYFYDDFEKIRQVLNDKDGNFYKKITIDKKLFSGMEVDVENKAVYRKQNIDALESQAFISIYQPNNTDGQE